jgi:hypothetical protein
MTLLRGGAGDSVREGDEILVDLDEIPNQNYRLGDNPRDRRARNADRSPERRG